MKTLRLSLLLFIAVTLMTGCAQSAAAQNPTPTQAAATAAPSATRTITATPPPTLTLTPEDTSTPIDTPTRTPRPSATVTPLPARDPDDWKNWPIVPEGVSPAMIVLYREGIANGNLKQRFSKVGDCQNITTYFLANFDKPGRYTLGDYSSLQETIDFYSGSFQRESVAVRGGLNVAAVQNSLFTRSKECEKGENSLACELRLNTPAVVLVSYEELWDGDTEKFTRHYENMILYLLEQKTVPILGMTGNNAAANQIIAELAVKYELPVWNLWAALQPLNRRGIVDGFHLTQFGDIFDFTGTPRQLSGWHMRNLTALQAIDAVRRALESAGS
ncbi:MAG TPA: hypothetical protein VIO36_14015 [Anaerolineaceae bacterium]